MSNRRRSYEPSPHRRNRAHLPRAVHALSADLVVHMTASRRAEEWAQRCLDLRAAGKLREAQRCEDEVKFWLRRSMRIEARVNQPAHKESS